MKWNVLLLAVSVVLLLLNLVSGFTQFVNAASAIAEEIGPKLNVDVGTLAGELRPILAARNFRLTIFFCLPLFILTILNAIRLYSDYGKYRRQRNSK